jgi:branched-chain amino acid transport system permease protein
VAGRRAVHRGADRVRHAHAELAHRQVGSAAEEDLLSAWDLVQYVVSGLLVGGVYALMSIGLALIFGVMRVVNFAHGDFMMLGMYMTYYLALVYHVDALLGALVAIPAFFVLGLLVHRTLLARVTGGRDPQRQMDAQLILTLGLSLVITNATAMLLSPMPRQIRTRYATEAFRLGPLLINHARSYAFVVAVLLAAVVFLFLTRTDLGKAMRAAADEPEAAGYQGIDVRAMHGIAFGIGVALVAAAGGLLATYHPIEPTVGGNFILLMFVAVVLGGLGSIPGAFVGGLVIGLVQSLTLLVLPLQLQNAGVFVIFLAALYCRPQGLFGRRLRSV